MTQPHNFRGGGRRELPYPNNFDESSVGYTLPLTPAASINRLRDYGRAELVSCDLETTGLDPHTDRPTIIALSCDGSDVFQLSHEDMQEPETREAFNNLMANPNVRKVFHNAVFDMGFMIAHYGTEFANADCTYVMRRLLICGLNKLASLDACADEYLDYYMDKGIRDSFIGNTEITGPMRKYAAIDVAVTWHLWPILDAYIDIEKMRILYDQIEKPLVPIVAQMKVDGIGVDLEYLAELDTVLANAIETQEKQFHDKTRAMRLVKKVQTRLRVKDQYTNLAGQLVTDVIDWDRVNINSSTQMKTMLNSLGFAVDSADAKTLEALPYNNADMEKAVGRLGLGIPVDLFKMFAKDLIGRVLLLRGLKKTMGTYVRALQLNPAPGQEKKGFKGQKGFINPKTGRVHGDFNQVETDTGRFSASKPNLQNQTRDDTMAKITGYTVTDSAQVNSAVHLPEETRANMLAKLEEKGKVFIPGKWSLRRAFKPKDGYGFITWDYSKCEMLILGDITDDAALLLTLNDSSMDTHKYNASLMFGIPYSEVTPDQRQKAKGIFYSKAYGAGIKNISAQLGMSVEEGKKIVALYDAALAGVTRWSKARAVMALQYGYSYSMAGRRRYYEAPRSGFEKASIERKAVNMPIQATNADIAKLAMVLVAPRIKPFGAKIVLCVHDELVAECPLSCIEEVNIIVRDAMLEAEGEFLTKVKCEVEGGHGRYWGH